MRTGGVMVDQEKRRKWIGFVLCIVTVVAAVFSQKIWGQKGQDELVYRVHPLIFCVFVGLAFFIFGQLRTMWRDSRVMGSVAAFSVLITAALVILEERATDAPIFVGVPPGLSIITTGLLMGDFVLTISSKEKNKCVKRGIAIRIIVLSCVALLAAVLDCFVFSYTPMRSQFSSVTTYRIALFSLPLLAYAVEAAVLLLLVDFREIPFSMSLISLVVATYPYVILLTGFYQKMPFVLKNVANIFFDPSAAVYGVLLGLALGGIVAKATRRRLAHVLPNDDIVKSEIK